jgi:hypothetical protein
MRRPNQATPPPAAPAAGGRALAEPTTTDRALLRIGAICGVLGLVLSVVMETLHPSKAPPNDSAAAFREYAASDIWTVVHIGQFLANLLIVLALIALARSAARQPGLPGALAALGAVAAVIVAAVFAVQMAVDGVALKGAVDAWMRATGPDKAAAFQMADDIRWVEKGLAAFFQILSGITLLALGLSVALGRAVARWLGWVGVLAAVGFLVGGTLVAHTGFSPEAGTAGLATVLLLAVFLLGGAASLWRTSRTAT